MENQHPWNGRRERNQLQSDWLSIPKSLIHSPRQIAVVHTVQQMEETQNRTPTRVEIPRRDWPLNLTPSTEHKHLG